VVLERHRQLVLDREPHDALVVVDRAASSARSSARLNEDSWAGHRVSSTHERSIARDDALVRSTALSGRAP
jgi:hypothetical protein